ncbi:MAG: ATP-binding cassette domain-containing protein [Acidimicrobiia bacterium]|nr:ATP-binding cassette domain-containing protein [Acidimicrobiia bacterium]
MATHDPDAPVIRFVGVSLAFDDKVILDRVSFELLPGRAKVILGGSGVGKSTVLRLVLGLLKPDSGEIHINGERVDQLSEEALMPVRDRLGMVFQEGALFDSLTVRENVGYKLFEGTSMPIPEVDARVMEVLGFVGLDEFVARMPSELSGGQRRRVAIARALTAKPQILLYDEPTTGLDPITALTIDDEIIKLRDLEEVSTLIVTHQLRDAFYIASHMAVREQGALRFVPASPEKMAETEFLMLKDSKVLFEGTLPELRASTDPYVKAFLE